MLLVKLVIFILLFWPICNILGQLFIGAGYKVSSGIRHFFGLAVLTSLVSSFWTLGLTILLPIAGLLFIRVFTDRKHIRFVPWTLLLKESIPVIVYSLILCLCFVPLMYQLESSKVLTGDYLFYGKLGEYLISTGVETKDLNYFSDSAGTQVYHYLDLWIIGWVTKVINVEPNQSVIFVYYSLFLGSLFAVLTDFIGLFIKGLKTYFISVFFGVMMIGLSG